MALFFPAGVQFAYVNADGITYQGPETVFPHTAMTGDEISIAGFGSSFAISLYSAEAQSTQLVATGCQSP